MSEINKATDLTPTSLEEIQERVGEQVVTLPGFGDGKPFYCRLRRISLLQMAEAGAIPNPLMSAVTELYEKGKVDTKDLKLAADVMCLMAKAAMVEPTLDAIEAAGLALTDMQLTAIYLYAQRGPVSLRPFRDETEISQSVSDSASVADTAKRIAGDPRWLRGLLHR